MLQQSLQCYKNEHLESLWKQMFILSNTKTCSYVVNLHVLLILVLNFDVNGYVYKHCLLYFYKHTMKQFK